ncbi:Cytochrome P450, family 4, subfamily f, polypeptide 40 [Oopsacas minuta]|uniref:Cytochrome P450, family 4, subfamily f, polypeptide 40 n=1 Tax=Oopsacas minuta TaxID=111878 RepID=A0AAV7JKN9_9METZ|nr:Cytochrome P450, family 4, subfamily f, polypeptide 40 [Oopsacas minuta]
MEYEFISEALNINNVITVIVLLLCALCIACIRPVYLYWKFLNEIHKIPGPYLHPLWGSLDRYPPNEKGLQNAYNYILHDPDSKLILTRLGPFKYFIIFSFPEEISNLLCMKSTLLPKDDYIYGTLRPYLGDGLLISNFYKWQTRRKMLTPGFHYEILNPYVLLYNEIVEVFIRKCEEKMENGAVIIPIFESITLLTLDVMLQCVCSYKSDCQIGNEEDKYVNAIKANAELTNKQITTLLYHCRPIFYLSPHGFAWRKNNRIVKEQSMKVVQSRRKFVLENPKLFETRRSKDFIDIILTSKDKTGKALTDEGIVEEMTTFLFAGHDTTASAISWTLHLLGLHQKYQIMCREEVREVLKDRKSEQLLCEDLPKLTFLTMCIKESMRLYPPVYAIYRKANDDIHLERYFIPKGTSLVISIGNLHTNPHIWENPLEYNPMRFDCELPGGHPFSFLTFSAGHRNCIGQKFAFNELLVSIGRIINKFDIESLSKEPKRVSVIILKPEEDLNIRFRLAE